MAVKLEISGIKSPATNRASSEYSWSISHIGSTMVMTTWSGTGIATAPGQLTLSDWVPSNGYSVSEIV